MRDPNSGNPPAAYYDPLAEPEMVRCFHCQCEICDGKGKVFEFDLSKFIWLECPQCGGNGSTGWEMRHGLVKTCRDCGGSREVVFVKDEQR